MGFGDPAKAYMETGRPVVCPQAATVPILMTHRGNGNLCPSATLSIHTGIDYRRPRVEFEHHGSANASCASADPAHRPRATRQPMSSEQAKLTLVLALRLERKLLDAIERHLFRLDQ